MHRAGTNPASIQRRPVRSPMAMSTSALPSHTTVAAVASPTRLATRSVSPVPTPTHPSAIHTPPPVVDTTESDMNNVCMNPASPSYGTKQSRQPSTSLPSMSSKRPAEAWPRSAHSSYPTRTSVTIEEVGDDDDDDDLAIAQAASDFMDTRHTSTPILAQQNRVPSLSQIPMRPLFDVSRVIPTGVPMFFHSAPGGTDHAWVLTQSTRLTSVYRSVGMFPFASIAATQNVLDTISRNMAIGWRSMDAAASYYGLTKLKEWFIQNIAGPMYAQEMADVPFETIFMSLSQNGSGVRSFLIEACRQAAINIIVVGNEHVFDGEMVDLVTTAHQAQPCVVLFDRCDNWFTNEYSQRGQAYVAMMESYRSQCRSSAQAAYGFGGGVAVRPDRVWTIFSMGFNSTVDSNFYRVVAQTTEVCAQPSTTERVAFMTKTVSTLYTTHVGEAQIHLVQAEAHTIAALARDYCTSMSTASLGEMHMMISTLAAKKQRELVVTNTYRANMRATELLPTSAELLDEIKRRRERAEQHAAESRRLAPGRR